MTRPLVAFQIRGKDPARLDAFYREIFGWETKASPLGIIEIPAGIGGPEIGVGGFIMTAPEPHIVLFIQVLDLLETLAKAEALGGKRIREPLDIPGGPTIAEMADPEGNHIGLVKQ